MTDFTVSFFVNPSSYSSLTWIIENNVPKPAESHYSRLQSLGILGLTKILSVFWLGVRTSCVLLIRQHKRTQNQEKLQFRHALSPAFAFEFLNTWFTMKAAEQANTTSREIAYD